ncbi:MarR family transcriptional regulator [Nocardia vinacea]|uniref:MarR family transcriptional regulator n=1 Tax=Nocardia vinacea TaxID=96468 RepID=UPI00340FB4A7
MPKQRSVEVGPASPRSRSRTSRTVGSTAELADALRDALRELRIELAVNARRVATKSGLRDSDLDVLDLLDRFGPQSPTTLARRMSIRAATMTGVLTRLENSGWVTRIRDIIDRRSVQIQSTGFERLTDVYHDANLRLDDIASGLSQREGAVIMNYLRQVTAAVREATAAIAVDESGSQG